MADEGSARKAKRSAEYQINKDADPEGDGESEEVAVGTFQRASAEVLKTRKIVKARPRPSSVPSSSSSLKGGTAAAAAAASNPFASLGSSSTPADGAAAAATPNPFQNVVLSTKPAVPASAPAPAATPEGGSASKNGGASSNASPAAGATVAEVGSSPPPASTEKPSSATPEAAPAPAAAGEAPAAATSDVSAKDKDEAVVEPAAAPAAVAVLIEGERKEGEGVSTDKETEDAKHEKSGTEGSTPVVAGEGTKEAGGDADKGEKKPAAAAAATGVVSFAALGGVAGATPFQSLGTSKTTVGGAAPLSFGGFGSASGSLPNLGGGGGVGLGLPSASLNGGTTPATAPAAAAAPGPVLSFGSSTGTAGAFSSFTSFAAAPAVGGGWGSPPKNGAKEGGGAGASAGGGAADREKKDGGGAAGGGARSSSDAATKPPIELMDPSEVVNGEELEECTYKARGKLFRLVNKEWVEMGIGNMKVLRSAGGEGAAGAGTGEPVEDKDGGKEKKPSPLAARLVMRREAGQQVMINVALQAQTKCSAQGEKALLLTCFTPEGPATYLLKVKTPEIAGSLKTAIDVLLTHPSAEEGSSA